MNNRRACKFAFGLLAVAIGFLTSTAQAQINWAIQSANSQVSFSGQMGLVVWNYDDGSLGGTKGVADANGNPTWLQLYNGVAQNDVGVPNWGPYAGNTSSLVTSSAGTISTTTGFLSNVNFGADPPDQTDFNSQFHPTVTFAQSGNYLPESDNGGSQGGPYGNPTPAQTALTLVGASGNSNFPAGNPLAAPLSAVPGGGPADAGGGPNGTGTAGRIALTNTAGYASSGNTAVPVSQVHITDPSVNPAGTVPGFDTSKLTFTGVLAAAYNYIPDASASATINNLGGGFPVNNAFTQSSFYSLVLLATGGQTGIDGINNNYSGAQAQGWITRAGTNTSPLPGYILHIPYQADIPFGGGAAPAGSITALGYGSNIGTAIYFDLRFQATFTALSTNVIEGDANSDGVVNGLDVNQVAGHWLATDPNRMGAGDVNGDGVVNGLDVNQIASHWLQSNGGGSGSGSGTAVPEPGSVVLLGLGALGLALARRRMGTK
jgi:hypothetical protein